MYSSFIYSLIICKTLFIKVALLAFFIAVTNYLRKTTEREKLYWGHGFSQWSAGSIALRPKARQKEHG
jgi:hypothetical protein